VRRQPPSATTFEEGTRSDSAFTRSVVNLTDAHALADAEGVEEATPMGLSLINARSQEGTPIDLTLVGVEPDSFIAPEGLPAINPG
jgi:putative ABC transport system permease protein